ncbi:MAG: hypothetical protein KAI75_10440, partial [Desulfobulbaceae bacterium]|nr:hypothetical protein [Desulfobulbaceae bacterium]
IGDNQRMLSFEICIEHERDGAYDVDSAEAYLAACGSCSMKHKVQSRIDNESIALIESAKKKKGQASKAQKNTAITNRYDCAVCNQPIPDGLQMFTTSSGYERYVNDTLEPEGMFLHMTACIKCSEEMDLESRRQKPL